MSSVWSWTFSRTFLGLLTAWSFSVRGTFKYPEMTAEKFVVKTGDKGFHLEVKGVPERTLQKNGVDMISVSGKNSFVIKVD